MIIQDLSGKHVIGPAENGKGITMKESDFNNDLNRIMELAGLDPIAEAPRINPDGSITADGPGQLARPGAMPPGLGQAKPTLRPDGSGQSRLRQRLAQQGAGTDAPAASTGGPARYPAPSQRTGTSPDARDAARTAAANQSAAAAMARRADTPDARDAARTAAANQSAAAALARSGGAPTTMSPDARDAARTDAANQSAAAALARRTPAPIDGGIPVGTTRPGQPSRLRQRMAQQNDPGRTGPR